MEAQRNGKPIHHATILRELLASGGMSRAQLQRRTGLRSNTVIEVANAMKAAGWVREAGVVSASQRLGGEARGRPAVRLEVDPVRREVIGIALRPRALEAVRLNLLGEPHDGGVIRKVPAEAGLARAAADVLRELRSERTLAVGISSPGFLDESDMRLLFGATAVQTGGLSLAPLLDAAGDLPLALDNDLHALGDRWRLAHPGGADQTVLLVGVGDGRIGASLMASGGPADPGCLRGGNELGHTQVATLGRDAPRCFCGQSRCIERVFGTAMIARLTGRRARLSTALKAGTDEAGWTPPQVAATEQCSVTDAGRWVLDRLAEAVANAINFARPDRLIWVDLEASPLLSPAVEGWLSSAVRGRLLPVLRERVKTDHWDLNQGPSVAVEAQSAAHLALATLTGRRAPAAGAVTLVPLAGVEPCPSV